MKFTKTGPNPQDWTPDIPEGWRIAALSDNKGGTIHLGTDGRCEWFYGDAETGVCPTLAEAAAFVEMARRGVLEGEKVKR